MQKQVEGWKDKITVSGLHTYLIEQSKGFDYDKTQINKPDFYNSYLPSLLSDIFKKGIIRKFDKLIIDEGQDLILEKYLNLFDSMVEGGLSSGNWEIYGDFERQAIFSQLSKEEMLLLINEKSQPTKFILKINCRNTKQIGEETSLISGFDKPPFLLEHLEGIPVEYLFYKDEADQRALLETQLGKFSVTNFPLNELTIISPKKFERSCINGFTGYYIKEIRNTREITGVQDFICFATIQSYKGMESNYILITDIEDLTTDIVKSLLYVGMSRARYGLIMFISESMRNEYGKLLKRKLN